MSINTKDLFDLPGDVVYLNTASFSAQLRSVTAVGQEAVRRKSFPWNIHSEEMINEPERLRGAVARVFNTSADGIALIPAVSYGVGIAAANLPLRKGQNIVVLDKDFPSNYYTWREHALRNDGVIKTVVNTNGSWTQAILEAINEQTGIVSVANCHWTNGAYIDLEQVSRKAKAVGAALVIDASQSLGVLPMNLDTVQPDFVVSVGYKWLLGPYGLGYLYVAPKWRENGVPLEYSWLAKQGSEDFTNLVNYRNEYRPGARRFDMGEYSSFIHIPMAIQAVNQVLDWGQDNIRTQLRGLTQYIEKRATDIGIQYPTEHADHLIGLGFSAGIPAGFKEALEQERVYVSVRGNSIRVAPYLFTTTEHIDKLFSVIRRFI